MVESHQTATAAPERRNSLLPFGPGRNIGDDPLDAAAPRDRLQRASGALILELRGLGAGEQRAVDDDGRLHVVVGAAAAADAFVIVTPVVFETIFPPAPPLALTAVPVPDPPVEPPRTKFVR